MKRISIFILIAALTVVFTESGAFALSRLGSSGGEVSNIQSRLKEWGYYNGAVDGVYGQGTADAVKRFQQKNGLTADGVAGPATLAKIGLPTGQSAAGNASSNDVTLLAMVINGEARGEPYEGQVAVGAVVLNRVRHPSFPNTIAGVIYQKGAFTAVDDGQIDEPIQQSCFNAARDALNGWDPTGGAIYYFNPETATSKWIWSRPLITVIGRHRFCS